MTPDDSLALLLNLPPTRLAQMLCLLARRRDLQTAWVMLAWVETLRFHHPILSQDAAFRWSQTVLAGRSLSRLLCPGSRFNAEVLDLVSWCAFEPLLTATPPQEGRLAEVAQGWDCKDDHVAYSLSTLFDHLPGDAQNRLRALPGSQFLTTLLKRNRRACAYQQSALLFQVLSYLSRTGTLPDSMLVNLFSFENSWPTCRWHLLLEGLHHFTRVSTGPPARIW